MLNTTSQGSWPKPGAKELEIRILDEGLFEKSPWLRETRFWGSYTTLIQRFTDLRVVAVSIRPNEPRNRGRIWFLRSKDSFDLPCPAGAVIPSTIAPNAQSMPYAAIHENRI